MNISTILTIASLVTGVTAIITACIKLYKFFRNLEEKYEQIEDTLKENTIHILKMAVLNTDMPLVDRIHAGEVYISMGGNGTIKKVYTKLLDDYEEQQKEYHDKINHQ